MKRDRQNVDEILNSLMPIEATWLDSHAEKVIGALRLIPLKASYTPKDIARILDGDFDVGLTVLRLFLDLSKDEATVLLKTKLGTGGIGVNRFRKARDQYLEALRELGLLDKMKTATNTKLHWADLLIERLKGGRGSAIKGQQRGRGLEDFVHEVLQEVFPEQQYDIRCRFTGSSGQSTEKTDFAIPSKEDPCILIETKAYGATGSKQTDVLGEVSRIIKEKRGDTTFLLVTDGVTWRERSSDLRKLVQFQNRGDIGRIYTKAMRTRLLEDLSQLKAEHHLA